MAIPYESGESAFFWTVKLNTFVRFLDPETRKWPFRARVVKAKVVLHGKIDSFGHTPDQNGHSVRERWKHFFLNGKNEYFCSIVEPRGPTNYQKYSVLPSKKRHYQKLIRNCQFWSGACPNLSILPCKTTFAFTTLARNSLLRGSRIENGHSCLLYTSDAADE